MQRGLLQRRKAVHDELEHLYLLRGQEVLINHLLALGFFLVGGNVLFAQLHDGVLESHDTTNGFYQGEEEAIQSM